MQPSNSTIQGDAGEGSRWPERSLGTSTGSAEGNAGTLEAGRAPNDDASAISSDAQIVIKPGDEATVTLILKEMLAYSWESGSVERLKAHYKKKIPKVRGSRKTSSIIANYRAHFQAHCPGYRKRCNPAKGASTEATPDSGDEVEEEAPGPSNRTSARLAGLPASQIASGDLPQTGTGNVEKMHQPATSSHSGGQETIKQGQSSGAASVIPASASHHRMDAQSAATPLIDHADLQSSNRQEMHNDITAKSRSASSSTAQPTSAASPSTTPSSTTPPGADLGNAMSVLQRASDELKVARQDLKRKGEDLEEGKASLKKEKKLRMDSERESKDSGELVEQLQKERDDLKAELATARRMLSTFKSDVKAKFAARMNGWEDMFQ